jgi:hypothetical protein
MVEGQQYPFSLEGVWKSEIPPKPGLVVEVEFDPQSRISGITAVPEGQIAKEQAEAAMAAAKEKGAALASNMVAKFGLPSLVAGGLLIVGWFFLSAVSIKTPFGGFDVTFWQILGFLNANNPLEAIMQGGRSGPSTGMYGFFAFLAIVGPFVHHFWKDKRAALGGLLPLLFMVVVGLMINSSINSLGGSNAAASPFGDMASQMREEAMKAVSIGMGIYLSILASLYFAAMAAKQYLLGRAASEEPVQYKAAA